ncbi:uncharacterized protein ccdc178 isoform 2-T3 [Syngnathus typhle]
MQKNKDALQVAPRENQRLASKYEGHQKLLMEAKRDVLSDEKHMRKSFCFYARLSLLQKRMHKASVKYFRQRSLGGEAQLDRCQALCREAEQKIKTAQEIELRCSKRPSPLAT